jgi:molecular chaperone GrpE
MKEDKKKKNNPEPATNPSAAEQAKQMGENRSSQPDQVQSADGNHPANTPTNPVVDPLGLSQGENTASAHEAQPPMVALSMEEFDTLQSDLEKNRTQAASYFDGWQHERADFLNYKKRVERDSIQTQQNALVNVVKKYLVILDDLERALKTRPVAGEGIAWSEGIELIYRKLFNLVENEGVRQMGMDDSVFDPTRHEAITYEESPAHQSGQIIEVIQPGYLLGDRVIRPAQVRVAK